MHYYVFAENNEVPLVAVSEVQILSVVTIEQRSLLHVMASVLSWSFREVDGVGLRGAAIDEGVHIDPMVVVQRSALITSVLHQYIF